MQATAKTVLLVGLDGQIVSIEADVARGAPMFEVLGLAEGSARETRLRIRAALQQIGIDLSEVRVTVNLALGGIRSPNPGAFDLPAAVAVLAAMGKIEASALEGVVLLGELSLTGATRPVRGVLPALRVAAAKGITRVFVPRTNAVEAGLVQGLHVSLVEHLNELVRHLRSGDPLGTTAAPAPFAPSFGPDNLDIADIRGQSAARRALEIAAAGGHNLLLVGQSGQGKTMLARRLATILPPMTLDEALDVSAVHSISGHLSPERPFVTARPFRAPHHTVSAAGMVGGGAPVRPGEVSLAHGGVLLLDELPEFKPAVLDAMRQPIEDGFASVFQAGTRMAFPARPLVVGAMNPCPCGNAGDVTRTCGCSPERVKRYRGRVTDHLMARFGLHVMLAPINLTELQHAPRGETSETVRARVVAAREVQAARARRLEMSSTNGALLPRDLERVAKPDEAGARILSAAIERLGLSARSYGHVLRLARTIADLDGSDAVRAPHVAEAVHGRALDRADVG